MGFEVQQVNDNLQRRSEIKRTLCDGGTRLPIRGALDYLPIEEYIEIPSGKMQRSSGY